MTQCALHTAAASLVRESDVLHGVRANAGFDVPLEDSCLGGVSGNLQDTAQRDSACCETDLLREVLETEAVSSSMAESDRLLDVSECMAVSSLVAESDRLHEMWKTSPASSLVAETVQLPAVLECSAASSFAAETDQLHMVSESSGARDSAWRSRVRGLRLRQRKRIASREVLLRILRCHLIMLAMSIHEVFVARMVSMTCMMHARIHIWVHMLHASIHLVCTVHVIIQGDM